MTSITVLVMFKCNNRRLTLAEDITLEGLKEEFMKAFDDAITHNNVVPHELLFQKFDPCYQEWVDMTEDEKICDGEKIRVLDLSNGKGPLLPGVYPHRIKADATYRIWSLVSRSKASLMMRNSLKIKCEGGASDKANVLDIQAKDVSTGPDMKLYRLELSVPNQSSKVYLITGKGENKDVVVQEVDASSPPDTTNTKFEPRYFYSFTQFRCLGVNGEDDLYLASDENGKTTLAKAGALAGYPNPATLFICSQYA